jgi:hypothetical protein
MRLSRAIPVLVAGAAAVWFLDRRRLLPGQTRPALPWPPDPGARPPDPAPRTEEKEEEPPPAEPEETPDDEPEQTPPEEPQETPPAAPEPGFIPSEQPTTEQPAVEQADVFGAEALDVTAVVDDLIAPVGDGPEDAIVDAEVVDDADERIARIVGDELAQLPGVPADALSVEVVDGIVILRGEIDRPGTISELDQLVRRVDGVVELRNLLHLPGTPPPT